MIGNRFRRKIEDLREQPEHVRMRAAFIMTGVSGLAMTIVWLTILLPLQLRLNGSDDTDSPAEVAQQSPPPAAQVGGIQDRAKPSAPASFSLPQVSPSPTPDTTAPALPVQLQP